MCLVWCFFWDCIDESKDCRWTWSDQHDRRASRLEKSSAGDRGCAQAPYKCRWQRMHSAISHADTEKSFTVDPGGLRMASSPKKKFQEIPGHPKKASLQTSRNPSQIHMSCSDAILFYNWMSVCVWSIWLYRICDGSKSILFPSIDSYFQVFTQLQQCIHITVMLIETSMHANLQCQKMYYIYHHK